MKSKNLVIGLVGLLIVLGAAYFFTSSDRMPGDGETEDFSGKNEISLRAGEERKVGDLFIKMLGITEDSRCPVGARCIWAGKASANIELRLGDITGATRLDTGSNPYMFENYLIGLINVKPEKIQNQEIAQAEYIAVFSIETIDNNGTDEGGVISGKSGIKGFVTMGPICPVQRVEDKNCNAKPVKADIVIKDKKEDVVKSIETTRDGSFSVELSPGQYVIYTNSEINAIGGSKPEYVTVEEGKFAEVTIRIDTGIR